MLTINIKFQTLLSLNLVKMFLLITKSPSDLVSHCCCKVCPWRQQSLGPCCCGWVRRTGCWQGPGSPVWHWEKLRENRVQEPPHGECSDSQSQERMEAADKSERRASVLPKRPHWHGCCDEPLSPTLYSFLLNSSSLFARVLTHLPHDASISGNCKLMLHK